MKTYNFSREFQELVTETAVKIRNQIMNSDTGRKYRFDKISFQKRHLAYLKIKNFLYRKHVEFPYFDVKEQENYPFEYLFAFDAVTHLSPKEIKEEETRIFKALYQYEGYPEITKDKEIELLEKLCCSNSYFAEAFRTHFEQMKENIQNDMPIMLNIELSEK